MPQISILRLGLVLPLVLSAPAAVLAQDTPAEAPATADVYAVARDHGTRILTMPDKKGPLIVAARAGQLLHVTGKQRAAFLPVEVPGGFPVWVHGRNLKATEEEGVLRVTANAVLQRPAPSTGLESYPLEVRLHGGDHLRVIERKDETKALAEDWVRVWSAPGSYGYVLADAIDSIDDSNKGAALWAEELAGLGDHTIVVSTPEPEGGTGQPGGTGAAKPTTAALTAEAKQLLADAEAMLATERERATPDLAGVRAAFEKVLAMDAGADIDKDARAGLVLVEAVAQAKALESDLEAEKTRRTEDILERQRRIWEESRQRDPLGGRYDARGVLERKSRAGEPHRYVLRWGPDLVCEVRCKSGRYDLDLYAGRELGISGLLTYGSPDALLDERPVLEVGRIEVLRR